MLGKKGSSAVMLTMLFVSMIAAIGIICEAASGYAARSQAEATFELAGRSVLGAYYRPLRERYGLFGVQRSEEDISAALQTYTEDSLSSVPITEMYVDDILVERSGFSLTEREIFKKQIVEYMKFRILSEGEGDGILNAAGSYLSSGGRLNDEIETLEDELESSDAAGSENNDGSNEGAESSSKNRKKLHEKLKNLRKNIDDNYSNEATESENVLKNKRISDSLPSKLFSSESNELYSDENNMADLLTGLSSIRETIYIDAYITSKFRYHTTAESDVDLEESETSFFKNEVEYILCGELSDDQNYANVKKYLYTMRMGLNVAFLYSDPEKRNETLALATSLTPGPAVPLTQLLIISAWSAYESKNDISILEAGGCVPLIKSPSSWKTDVESLLQDRTVDVAAENSEGLDYQGYLKILLKLKNEEDKLYRIMDLIQINLKGTESESFVLSECYTGFNLTAEIRKKSIYAGISNRNFSISMSHTY